MTVAVGSRVVVCDPEHPHYGESGTLTGETIQPVFQRQPMTKIKLEDCRHGTDACFVSPGQIRLERRSRI